MDHKRKFRVFVLSAVCILISYFGKMFSDQLGLPLWLDSVGTAGAAYLFGPFSGAVVGLTVNFLYSIRVKVELYYGLVNMAVGICVGICARKGLLKTFFGTVSTAFLVTILSVTISVPLNYLVFDGSCGNIWGDGMSAWLRKMGCNPLISNIVGEFYPDFLDKSVTMLILFAAIRIFRKWKKQEGKQFLLWGMVFMLILSVPCENVCARTASGAVENTGNYQEYIQTVYNGENGLPGGEANSIAQTKDGVLWIGSYGGLYRYTGSTFQWMNDFPSVKSVNCLFTDEAGRMWIGTNDNGLSICINQSISNVVDRKSGLPSNSVRCIAESSDGYYYVGTTGSLVVMSLSGGLKVDETIPEIVYADNICTDQNGNAAVVTNEGELYLVRGKKVISRKETGISGESFNCCTFGEDGKLYVGTSSNRVEIYRVSESGLKKCSEISCGNLSGINSVYFAWETMFFCADNGIAYLEDGKEFQMIDTGSFNSSIDRMMVDYQGNLWFTSSRLGLLRLCPSVFQEIYKGAGLQQNVVNAVTGWQGSLYIGTDSGLDLVNESTGMAEENFLTQKLEGVRIRCFLVDSGNHLWVCTSDRGIWEVSEKGKIRIYTSRQGTAGDKFRSAVERKDGSVAVAGDSGITIIRNGKVKETVTPSQGLANPKVLSMYERKDGSLLAGTDGNGIAVIEKGKVTGEFHQEDGLSSDIILRIVPDSEGGGYFIVTGNGLCYMDEEEKIRVLDNFPYYNNYDVIEGEKDRLFVLSSAGIYVADKSQLLSGKEIRYELLDYPKGLRISLTPNSWNYVDEEKNLYLSGDRGAVRVNLNQYDIEERSYRMLLQEVVVDGKKVSVEKGEEIRIPSGTKEIEITPEIVNYSVNDPDIRVYLEGFDRNAKTMPQSKMTSQVYKNLPSGTYTLHVAVMDSRADSKIAENTYRIVKEKEIYDYWWFRLYAGMIATAAIAFLTWYFFRTQMQKTLRIQKMQLEWAKRQLKMGNEAILTIAQTVDAKDENTSQHSLRVSEYSVMIAKKLGYSVSQCEELRKIAMLHDIGKIGIPDQVLNKPGKLTDEEYSVMKSHVTIGAEILKNFTLIDHVADGALYHHERYDGHGYVHGLKGEEIPLNARIIGLADAFDAMTANRVYRKKLDMNHVLEELEKGKGTQFDPKLVDILLGLIEDGTVDVEKLYGEEDEKEHDDEG